MANALIPLTDGFEDIEAVCLIDVLRRGGVEVTTASVTGQIEVHSAHDIVMRADSLLEDVVDRDYDAIVIPGGPGTESLGQCTLLLDRISRQNDEHRLVCAICAAPAMLANAGLIEDGLHITCYPSLALELDRKSADAPVVQDGNVITGQAPGSALLFALVVLQNLAGDAKAQRIARGLVTEVLNNEI